ncbi:hypothetical protein FLA_4925 [Filimonas lacunae]|nr:hypothetical protein FLA_4925 [Filimonas lacunae]
MFAKSSACFLLSVILIGKTRNIFWPGQMLGLFMNVKLLPCLYRAVFILRRKSVY